jgi:hypothetical protein
VSELTTPLDAPACVASESAVRSVVVPHLDHAPTPEPPPPSQQQRRRRPESEPSSGAHQLANSHSRCCRRRTSGTIVCATACVRCLLTSLSLSCCRRSRSVWSAVSRDSAVAAAAVAHSGMGRPAVVRGGDRRRTAHRQTRGDGSSDGLVSRPRVLLVAGGNAAAGAPPACSSRPASACGPVRCTFKAKRDDADT